MENNKIDDQNLTRFKIDDREIILIGTAHVSQESVNLVQAVIESEKPDTVAVELCSSRFQNIKDPDRWKNLDLYSVIKEGKAMVLIAQLILSSFQKRIARDLNIKPGAEMIEAIRLAEHDNSRLVLADRDVRTTLKRTWANLGFWQSVKVFSALLGGLISNEKVAEADIEKLKTSDALEEAMKEFATHFPAVRESLIDERDQYLAEKIRAAEGKKIVAVIGAGHVPGIKNYIHTPRDLTPLELVPAPKTFSKLLTWGIPSLVVGIILYKFLTVDFAAAMNLVYIWVIITSVFAAFGAIVVKAHPLTTLTAGLVAPITSIHPLISVGMIAGLVEAYLRRPKVKDLETISEDITKWKSAVNNQALKILLVLVSTNFFGSIATLIGIERMVNYGG